MCPCTVVDESNGNVYWACTFDQRPNGEIRAVFKDITTSSVTFDKIQVTIQYTKTTDISNS